MPSASYLELNAENGLSDSFKTQFTARLPFLVSMRLRNLVYAATSVNLQPDKSEMVSSLIARTTRKPLVLDSIFVRYLARSVADFTPEVDDMRIAADERVRALHQSDVRVSGLKLPTPVHERLGLLTEKLNEYDDKLGVSMSSMVGALIVDAAVDGPALEELVMSYRNLTIGDFDPTNTRPQI